MRSLKKNYIENKKLENKSTNIIVIEANTHIEALLSILHSSLCSRKSFKSKKKLQLILKNVGYFKSENVSLFPQLEPTPK